MPAPRPFFDPEPGPTLPSGGLTFVRRRGSIDWVAAGESVRFLVNFPWFRLKAETEGLVETKGGDWLVRLQLDGFVTGLSIGNPSGVPVVSGYVDGDEGGGARLRLRNIRLDLKAWHARKALWKEGRPVAIWWNAWRDKDVAAGIECYLWIDQTELGEDWPAIIAIVDLIRQEVSNPSAFI